MSIIEIFREGRVGMKSEKYRRIAESLHWRQSYQKAEIYEYYLENPPSSKLRIQQIDNGELKGIGTGAFVWPAAHVLSKYLELHYGASADAMQGMRVCDIGTGTGITGLVAALLGAEVVLTDQQCILPLLRKNTDAILEEFSHRIRDRNLVSVCEYEWGHHPKEFSVEGFDLIIVSDCVLPKLYPIDILVEVRIEFFYHFFNIIFVIIQ